MIILMILKKTYFLENIKVLLFIFYFYVKSSKNGDERIYPISCYKEAIRYSLKIHSLYVTKQINCIVAF